MFARLLLICSVLVLGCETASPEGAFAAQGITFERYVAAPAEPGCRWNERPMGFVGTRGSERVRGYTCCSGSACRVVVVP